MQIKEIYIWTAGDSSVGINGASCKIIADRDFIVELDNKEDIASTRKILREAFSEIFDESAMVAFNGEELIC